ncbi:hypothetical protein DSM106972_000730 [Dulcicalothrix desertica PCC 7102]|uniref:HD domain-containing protein n=1 Tax=Dulcicalothrix desertica PCC 7102 TaxID=232991 RepID=A0A433VU34_9CYAN|nr:hypothetical protein [Dulcicalothrix desertica]RUT09579.1 hypothetical protein DSM106972_000730 [Dulcicalothrix desertica PCC 7102]TWH50776.1 hypothetical protein CAL7102_05120 [Dulcicalothrix desertica PCC 7102]
MKELKSLNDAYELLQQLGASPKLICHVRLVGEAADLLLYKIEQIGIKVDANFVRLGVALHDAGKIIYTEELTNKGYQQILK